MKEFSEPPRGALRRLSEEDIALWRAVTRGVARRPGAVLPESNVEAPEKPAKAIIQTNPDATTPPPSRRSGVPSLEPLERRARQRLARGMMGVDAAIDLHGMRQHDAHVALHRFLGRAQRNGAKIVLVITGKGDTRPAEGFDTGILRRSVPLWLGAPEWRPLVVGFEEATRSHGGSGALYVRIRRQDRRRD